MTITISESLKVAYDNFYDGSHASWRKLGAQAKAKNIKSLSSRVGRPQNVIEIGAGDGSILKELSNMKVFDNLYAVEISDSGVASILSSDINSLTEANIFDGYSLPYPDNFFNLAYCSHVLEHVEHPRILLREIARVSKHQIFEIPLDYTYDCDLSFLHLLSYGHINIYTPSLFRFLLKSEGFEIHNEIYSDMSKEVFYFLLKIKMFFSLKN